MSKDMKTEWVKEVASRPSASKSYSSKDKFTKLMDFLEIWRNRLEYVGASIREETTSGDVLHTVAEANNSSESSVSLHAKEAEKIRPDSRRSRNGNKIRCWLHNLDGYAGDHPIWKCKAFLDKPTKERADLCTLHKVCHRCLNLNCAGAEDIAKCIRGFRCSISGCDGTHNSLLHVDRGSTYHAGNKTDASSSATPLLPLQSL